MPWYDNLPTYQNDRPFWVIHFDGEILFCQHLLKLLAGKTVFRYSQKSLEQ